MIGLTDGEEVWWCVKPFLTRLARVIDRQAEWL